MTNSVRENSLSEAYKIFSDGIALSHIDKKHLLSFVRKKIISLINDNARTIFFLFPPIQGDTPSSFALG